ncbi:MAG TPA: hypothetical protein VMV56_03845 [Williamwhitmania sp.]|nr:hypothetical protein [Williamwhitmania sp.]
MNNPLSGLTRKINNILRHEGSHERIRRIKNTALANAVAKVVGVTVQVITVPLTLGYLGEERYGLWVAIASLIAFLQLSDLGIGNALVSIVAGKMARGDESELRELAIKAVKLLSVIAGIIFIIGALLVNVVDWANFFNVKDITAKSELMPSIYVFLLFFCISLPLSVAQQTRAGLQEGYYNAAFGAVGQLINLLLIYFVVFNKGGMPWLIIASMAGTNVLQIFNLLMLFKRFKQYKVIKYANHLFTSELFQKGALFFILQGAALVSYQTDVLVVSHFLTPSAVTTYSVTLKLFSLPSMLLSFFLFATWPAYTDAFARNDKLWIAEFFWKSLRLSLLANTVLSSVLFISGIWIINIWTNGVVRPSYGLLLGMVLWGILNAFGGNLTALLNGLHIIRFQIVLSVLAAISNVILSILLVKSIGISGPIWGSVIVLLITYSVSMVFVINLFKSWHIEKPI